jgi:hypothetical protein
MKLSKQALLCQQQIAGLPAHFLSTSSLFFMSSVEEARGNTSAAAYFLTTNSFSL